ncbi:MAG TPA: hypothetical protein VGH27_35950 [Streptosporangiaceae bacterium]
MTTTRCTVSTSTTANYFRCCSACTPGTSTAEQVRDRVLEAAEYIPPSRLGTCDDCGFSPFADDTSTSRDIAFAKIAARVEGTALASEQLGA